MSITHRTSFFAGVLAGSCALSLGAVAVVAPARATESPASARTAAPSRPGVCPPSALALHYSDALDKRVVNGSTIGGLSDIAYDPRSHFYASTVDNHAADPSRIWFYDNPVSPRIVAPPLVLKQPDGTPYTGISADNEGLAILPNGDYVVSSEIEPSIRIFGRDGVQRASLPVPARFRVAPAGQATSNATLEGLTISPNGRQLVAAMEGTLSGDVPTDGSPATYRRFLVYDLSPVGWKLTKQIGYRVDPGNRISEVQEYAPGKLLVMEAAFDPVVGNTIQLYAVTGVKGAQDVAGVSNLSGDPSAVLAKKEVADVTKCPTLGAKAKQPQSNPLMDNYEGMTTRKLIRRVYGVALVSDDNFGPTQVTRFLDLAVVLP